MKESSVKKPEIPGTPTRDLAAFVSGLRYSGIPKEAIEHAKTCILDHVGIVLYGSTLPWCRILYNVIREEGGPAKAACWGQPEKTSVTQAALYNSTAGHGFELDDLHHLSLMHPGPVTIPAPIAIAEHTGAGDGKEFLVSVVAGYEVSTRIGMALGQPHFFRGYHPQGTIGPFAATAAAARMLKLDAEQTLHALGLAGSQSAGLMAAQEGAMVKRLHSGRACQSGVLSALLAQRGFTGITDALEASFGGFCTTLGGDRVDAAILTAGLGKQWEILKVGFKPYSTAASIHTTLDVAKDLMNKHGFKADDCEKIVVHTTTMTWVHCCFNYEPKGVAGAQMNLLFGLASMLRYGDAFVGQYTEEAVRDEKTIRFIRERIQTMPDEELDKLGPQGRHAMWMEVLLKNGQRLTGREIQRKGSPENPMTREEVKQKFRKLASPIFPDQHVGAIERLVLDIEQVDDIRELTRLLIKKA